MRGVAKMKLKFLKAEYGIEFKIPENFWKTLENTFKKNSNLAVFSAIQFTKNLDEVQKKIQDKGYKTTISKPLRAAVVGQILGCDSYADSLQLDLSNIDGFIYIGDGYFHPNALLLAQENQEKIKDVIIVNVVQQIVEVIDKSHIEKYLKKRKGNLLKFHTSDIIGVFVTSKWGQEFKYSALKLKQMYPNKTFYYFISDNFADSEMENFPYLECWVNTACPRIGQDDVLRHAKPVVNIKDIWKK